MHRWRQNSRLLAAAAVLAVPGVYMATAANTGDSGQGANPQYSIHINAYRSPENQDLTVAVRDDTPDHVVSRTFDTTIYIKSQGQARWGEIFRSVTDHTPPERSAALYEVPADEIPNDSRVRIKVTDRVQVTGEQQVHLLTADWSVGISPTGAVIDDSARGTEEDEPQGLKKPSISLAPLPPEISWRRFDNAFA